MLPLSISVIVPVYNAERSLHRCVDSILAQTYTDFELLLIDDGSTDGSGVICDEYTAQDSRIRVFHKPHGGASSARNMGLDYAKGKWIVFADADDYAYPCWLDNYNFNEVQDVDLIQQGAKSDKTIWMDDEPSAKCGFDYYGDVQGYLYEIVSKKMVGYLWMKAFRSQIIHDYHLRFDTLLTLQEDGVFALNYLLHCTRIRSVNKQGYFYFAPEFSKKYKQSSPIIIYLNKIQMEYSETIFVNNYTAFVVRFFRDSFIDSLMVGFARKPKLEYLKEIRRLHIDDYNCSRLFKPLKWLIVHDSTYIMSRLALLVHSNLRLITKKKA